MKNSKEHTSLIIRIASMYYEEHLTQNEISDKLFISRSRVSRLLKEAEDSGIVEIHVNHTLNRDYYTENVIKNTFHINNALLYNDPSNNADSLSGVTELAASYLEDTIRNNMFIGVSWGNTIRKTIEALYPHHPTSIDIVQIMGAAATTNYINNSDNIIQLFASKYNAIVHLINAPLYIADPYVKSQILLSANIQESLALAKHTNFILTSVSTLNYNKYPGPWFGYMTRDLYNEIVSQNAVGCLLSRFFDINGDILDNEWGRQCIGASLEDLKRMKNVVLIASGKEKAIAVLGALRGGFINTLITDNYLAEELLDLNSKYPIGKS